jgi:putative protease
MSAKDMCLINHFNEIKATNISALKIEGRMKSEHYIATVVNAYRKVIDNINVQEYVDDITKCANRNVSIG